MRETPGTAFKTLNFLTNLQMGTIAQSVTLHKVKNHCSDKLSSLLGTFVSYLENEVL